MRSRQALDDELLSVESHSHSPCTTPTLLALLLPLPTPLCPSVRRRRTTDWIKDADLSFDEDDETYRALKTVLDGSVRATPKNVLIYAPSNRRHLLPENQQDNQKSQVINGELHLDEAIEEKISLSERFGLWLSFHPLDQLRYLDIVNHWLAAFGASETQVQDAKKEALQWALSRGSRSGRSANQFARDWLGRSKLKDIES